MKNNEEEKEVNLDIEKEEEIVEDVSFVESTEDGDILPMKDVVKKLREELKVCRKEKEEYLTGWQRAKADYINLQKEHGESHVKNSVLVKEKFLRNLLPALDSFDMAFANKEAWEKVDKNWRTGVEYIYQQIANGLNNEGIEKIEKSGITFDPLIHESVNSIKTDNKENNHKVEKVIQFGYKIGNKIIRPAKVNIYELDE
jgi:molecular chaperone GrpE